MRQLNPLNVCRKHELALISGGKRAWVRRAQCFVGSELVDYLVHTLGLEGREEATAAAQRWMDSGVFYHVTRTELFRDSTALFRFKEDEVGSILNMKSRWSGPVRQAVEVSGSRCQRACVCTVVEACIGRCRRAPDLATCDVCFGLAVVWFSRNSAPVPTTRTCG